MRGRRIAKNKYQRRLKAPRVAKYFSSLSEDVRHNLNLSMFLDDICLGIMPIGGESSMCPNYSVEIHGNSEHEPQVLAILESLPRRYQHNWYRTMDLKKLLSKSVEKFSRELTWHGRSVHKIFWDERDGGIYRLHAFTYKWLIRVFGKYIRMIPKNGHLESGKSYVSITEKDIWDIVMPKELGGYKGHRAILKKLPKFSQIVPSFLMDEVSQQKWSAYFNVKNYEKEVNLFVAKTTTRWGWNRRDYRLENRTEFYWNYRRLTLRWAQACLREHIIRELNQLFRRLQIDAEIVVKGLPTAREILKTQQQMCEGKITFDEASKKCSI